MDDKTRFIGLVITLILAIIWFVFVAIWFFSPKETCIYEINAEEGVCFNSTREANEYMKQRLEEMKAENPTMPRGTKLFNLSVQPKSD